MFHSFKFDPNTRKIYIDMATAVFICRVPSKSHSPEPEAAIAVGMRNIVIQQQIIKRVGGHKKTIAAADSDADFV